MKLSKTGEDFIKGFEALRLKAYRDQGGLPTIGWGHTRDVRMGQVIDKAKAEILFQQDLKPFEQVVNDIVKRSKVPVTQGMYDAMVALAFNIGTQGFAGSSVAQRLVRGDKAGAAEAFLLWDKVKGHTSKGLQNRRRAERKMFLS
jgi:lysozyme